MTRQRPSKILRSLHPHESSAVLNALLKAHPDLVVEAEALAASILDNAAWESIGDEVEHALRLLPLDALGARAGYHPGRGYTHECDAASEIVEETLAPYLDDIARRLALGMTASAHQAAAGVLAGLHACDGEHGGDSLLGYASEMQNYAYSVFALLKKHRAPLPTALYEVACPNWMHLYNG